MIYEEEKFISMYILNVNHVFTQTIIMIINTFKTNFDSKPIVSHNI